MTTLEADTNTSIFSLGVIIFVVGFLVAYLTGLARRNSRRELCLSTSGAFAKRGLIATAVIAALAIVAVINDGYINFLADHVTGPIGAVYVAASVVGIAILVMIGRRAFGGPGVNLAVGFFAVIAVYAGKRLVDSQATPAFGGGTLLLVLLFGAALAAMTWRVLLVRSGPVAARVAAPLGGIFPLLLAITALNVLTGNLAGDSSYPFWYAFVVIAAIALPAAMLFARVELSALRDLSSARVSSEQRPRSGEWMAIIISLGFLAVAVAFEALGAAYELTIFVPGTIVLTACVLDIVAEARALWRNPTIKAAFLIHQAQLAPLVAHALDSQGIGVHLRAQYLRRCLGILGALFQSPSW